jgi:two-component system response regulator FixJ
MPRKGIVNVMAPTNTTLPNVSKAIEVALIDDDAAVLDSLGLYFARHEVGATCFEAAEAFLAALAATMRFDCIVSDVRMPGVSGIDLVQQLKAQGVAAPIILITGRGDIDMAVSAIKLGAFDFLEKPFDENRLLASIREAVEIGRQKATESVELEKLQSRFKLLSARQREVMELAVAGYSNKEIGTMLSISPKTVENHRAWVMERVCAKNLAELVRMAMQLQEPH